MSNASRPYLAYTPLEAIDIERGYQDARWGKDRSHTWPEWMLILADEVGEVSRSAKHIYWGDGSSDDLRSELIQVAAVAVAMIEQLDQERES